ncbi:MAG TPA: alginate export family protein [Bryobacteraceae bacterium]
MKVIASQFSYGRKMAGAIAWAWCGLALFIAGPARAQSQPEPGRFTIGFEQRVRSDDWNNAIDMSDKANDQRDQVRDRTRLWVNVPVTSTFNIFVGGAAENTQRFGTAKHFDEAFFDQAYLHFRKIFVSGLELMVGRFDIAKGEGFVLFDGTPGDGPRSGYFNGADLSYSFGKQRIDLIGVFDPARDRFLPRIHDQSRVLQNWDEQAAGVYYTNLSRPFISVEAYYFYKKETNDILAAVNPQFQPDRHVSTMGGRVVRKLSARTDWVSEYARQWGAQHGGAVISAWGGYSYVKHTFNRILQPYIKGGYWALSGDDANTTGRVEGWDPLFSQYPKWSDMYVYTFSREVGIAYWTNLCMSQAETGIKPVRNTNLAFIWYHMNSFHPSAGSAATFGSGTGRGENLQVRFDYSPSPSWKAYLHYETHHPGDFYAPTRAGAYEVQAQVTYQFAFHPFEKAAR